MNASLLAFRGEFSAPTITTISTPFAAVGPVVARLRQRLLQQRHAEGCWCEPRGNDLLAIADVLLLLDFTGRDHDPRRGPLVHTLLKQQHDDGGWSSQPGAASDVAATVRVYLALTGGDLSHDAEPLRQARGRLAEWGAAACDEETRLRLSLFGQLRHADDGFELPAASRAEERALQVLDAYKPVRPRPRDAVLAHLFRNDLRLPGGAVWNPLRRWNARRAGLQLGQLLNDADPNDTSEPFSIFPLMALHAQGWPADDPAVVAGWRLLDRRIEISGGTVRITSSLAPLVDTARALLALHDAGCTSSGDWLWSQLVQGHARGTLTVEEAALALLALARTGEAFRGERPGLVELMFHALLDVQDDAGGWATPEQTGLVLETLGTFGLTATEEVVADAIGYLEATQLPDRGWPSDDPLRATWRVLAGLRAVGHDPRSLTVRRAANWLKRTQLVGGGWGETPESIAMSTAHAVLALMAAGDANGPEVDAGIDQLLMHEAVESVAECSLILMALAQFERHAAGPIRR